MLVLIEIISQKRRAYHGQDCKNYKADNAGIFGGFMHLLILFFVLAIDLCYAFF